MPQGERKRRRRRWRLLVDEGQSVTRTAREYGCISVRILILIVIEPRENGEESKRDKGGEEGRRMREKERRSRRMSSWL